MKELNYCINPINEFQKSFLWCDKRFSCWDGGVWTGKTSGVILKAHMLSCIFPGNRGAIFRYTEEDLRATVFKTFKDLVPLPFYDPKAGGKDNDGYTRYINGSEILWKHLKDLNIKALMSLELGWFVISQAEECEAAAYEMLETRMRYIPKVRVGKQIYQYGTKEYLEQAPWLRKHFEAEWKKKGYPHVHFPQYGMVECNPNGKDWIYYKFHPDVCSDKRNYYYQFMSTDQNGEYLKKMNPDYYRALQAKPESWKRRYFYGSREISEGSWHKGFSKKVHCYDPEKFNPFEKRKIRAIVAGFDYGRSAESSVVWCAIDNERNRWFFKELYGIKNTIGEHGRSIVASEAGFPFKPTIRLADPTVFFPSRRDSELAAKSGMLSIADEYGLAGCYLAPACNDQHAGFEHIEEGLNVIPFKENPITGGKGSPSFFFSLACENTIAQIEQQKKALKRNPMTGETEYIAERAEGIPDHAYDCVLYIANWESAQYKLYQGAMPRPAMRYADPSRIARRKWEREVAHAG